MTSYPSHEYLHLKPHEIEALPDVIALLNMKMKDQGEPTIRVDLWRRMMEGDDVLFVRTAGRKYFFECPIWPEESIEVIPLDDIKDYT